LSLNNNIETTGQFRAETSQSEEEAAANYNQEFGAKDWRLHTINEETSFSLSKDLN
jgi:hypothetical protein